jgi:GxxExxY protein
MSGAGMTSDQPFEGAHAQLTERIIGLFYNVSNDLGFGFLESVYRRAMLIALKDAGLRAEEEVAIPVSYRGRPVGVFYADIIVNGTVILELKAADQITKPFEAQPLHYLRSSPMEIGLILVFGQRATFKRIWMTNDRKPNLNHPS